MILLHLPGKEEENASCPRGQDANLQNENPKTPEIMPKTPVFFEIVAEKNEVAPSTT